MNCQNCGAPMKLEPGRRYFICEYCTSLYFPEEGEDGLRVLGTQLETGCPVCRLPLVLAWIGDTEVGHCTRCRGSLLPQQSFLVTINYLRAGASLPPAPLQPLNREELQRKLSCPRCRQPLDTHPYGGPGNVVVDNCPRCHLIWLDYRELTRIVSAPGRDRRKWF